jgi:long-chain acyl-CoA synthetase
MFVAWAQDPDLREAFAGVRILLTGAAPMPASVLEQITTMTGLPVFEGYGLTEAAPGVSTTLVDGSAKPGSVGKPLPGVEVQLVGEGSHPQDEPDPDDDDPDDGDGDTGEIWIRGDNLFSGYWPDGSEGPDEQGWYATGDVAYFDDDGDLVLVDRRKELIIVSGFNVYPREVEDAIAAHPDVAEVAVVGVQHPYTGEAVKAFVVANEGAVLTPDEVSAFVSTRLARFKWPTIVQVVTHLPHSATGKVAKGRLREGTV